MRPANRARRLAAILAIAWFESSSLAMTAARGAPAVCEQQMQRAAAANDIPLQILSIRSG
jgi:hypothetical protein